MHWPGLSMGGGCLKAFQDPPFPTTIQSKPQVVPWGELYRREPANKVRGVVGREGKKLGAGKYTDHSGGAMGLLSVLDLVMHTRSPAMLLPRGGDHQEPQQSSPNSG